MLETIITSSVLILIITFIRLVFRKSISRRLCYALWVLVLLRLALPVPLIQSPVSVMNVLASGTAKSAVYEAPMLQAPVVMTDTAGAVGNMMIEKIGIEPQTSPESAGKAPQVRPVMTTDELLKAVWLCGMAAAAVWFITVNALFYIRLRNNRRALPDADSTLPVYTTDSRGSPFLFGILKPSVYLTQSAAADAETLRYVLAHEHAHYRHLDHIWTIIRVAAVCVYWFNPLVWLAAFLSRADGELACDETVIKALGPDCRTAYGRALVGMIPVKTTQMLPVCATTMAASGCGMKTRIQMIVSNRRTTVSTLTVAVIVVAVAAGCTFTGADVSTPPVEPVEPVETADMTLADELSGTSDTGSGEDDESEHIKPQLDVVNYEVEYEDIDIAVKFAVLSHYYKSNSDDPPGEYLTAGVVTLESIERIHPINGDTIVTVCALVGSAWFDFENDSFKIAEGGGPELAVIYLIKDNLNNRYLLNRDTYSIDSIRIVEKPDNYNPDGGFVFTPELVEEAFGSESYKTEIRRQQTEMAEKYLKIHPDIVYSDAEYADRESAIEDIARSYFLNNNPASTQGEIQILTHWFIGGNEFIHPVTREHCVTVNAILNNAWYGDKDGVFKVQEESGIRYINLTLMKKGEGSDTKYVLYTGTISESDEFIEGLISRYEESPPYYPGYHENMLRIQQDAEAYMKKNGV